MIKSAIKYIIGFLLISVLFLFAMELLARVYFSIKTGKVYYMAYGLADSGRLDAMLGRGVSKSIPGSDNQVRGKTDSGYYITPVNMRYRKIALDKPADTFRIIALGGSTTWGDHAKDDQTYPYYLETILNDNRDAIKYEVINAGICGADVPMMTSALKKMMKLQPDLVIVHAGWNDVMKAIQEGSTLRAMSNQLVLWLMKHSLFFVALKEKIAYTLHQHAEYAWYEKDNTKKGGPTISLDHPSFNAFRHNLLELTKFTKGAGIESVLIRFPYRFYRDEATSSEAGLTSYFWKPAVERLLASIDDVAAKTHTPVIDCVERFNNLDKTDLFFDVMHTSPKGNAILAEIIYQGLKKDGLLPR